MTCPFPDHLWARGIFLGGREGQRGQFLHLPGQLQLHRAQAGGCPAVGHFHHTAKPFHPSFVPSCEVLGDRSCSSLCLAACSGTMGRTRFQLEGAALAPNLGDAGEKLPIILPCLMISGPAALLRAVWHLSAGACWDIYVYRSGSLALEIL